MQTLSTLGTKASNRAKVIPRSIPPEGAAPVAQAGQSRAAVTPPVRLFYGYYRQ